METSQQSTLPNFPILTSLSEDFPVSLSVLLEAVKDLTIDEVNSFLTSQGLLKKRDQNIFYLKMSVDCFLTTMDELTKSYCPKLLNWAMTRKQWCLTASFSMPLPEREFICLRQTGSRSLTSGKGRSKPHRFTLVANRGLEIRTVKENKKVCEMPSELYESLQGFPIGWTAGIPSTSRKKCLGNAVTVNVVKEIA